MAAKTTRGCLQCGKEIDARYCFCSIECNVYWMADLTQEDEKAEEG